MMTPPPLRWIDHAHRWVFLCVSLMRRCGVPVYGPVSDCLHRRQDQWDYSTAAYEQHRFASVLRALSDGPFTSCLEVACSEGIFSKMLAQDPRIESLVASDVSPRALARARERLAEFPHVQCQLHDLAGEPKLGGPYDLIFCMEVMYYLGASRLSAVRSLVGALSPVGRLVLQHQFPESMAIFTPLIRKLGLRVVWSCVDHDSDRPFQILIVSRN